MKKKVIKTIFSADRTRRVDVFERDDGTFGFEELEFGEQEQSWFPCGRYSEARTSSAEESLNEARGRIQWLT
jgi:hypothetical protein